MTALAGDVTDPDLCTALVSEAIARFGRLDHLDCNAGIDIITSKTHQRRSVPFPRFLAGPLGELVEGKSLEELVVTSPEGHVLRNTNFRRRVFDRAASSLRESGCSPPATAARLTRSTVALKLLADRRDELVGARTRAINRLHRLLTELVAGGAKRDLSATKARALLATVRPRDIVGRTRRALAVEQLGEVAAADRKLKAIEKRIAAAVAASGTGLTELFGIGPVGAARILGDVGNVARFPTKAHFASWTGTAPIDASSGEQTRHRLSRAGNRRLNHVLHMMAVVQMTHDTEGRTYYRRKRAAGKSSLEALRCLKRRLSDVIYHQLVLDMEQKEAAGPGGHSGATTKSSATDPTPTASSSDKSLPGPANHHATTDPALVS